MEFTENAAIWGSIGMWRMELIQLSCGAWTAVIKCEDILEIKLRTERSGKKHNLHLTVSWKFAEVARGDWITSGDQEDTPTAWNVAAREEDLYNKS